MIPILYVLSLVGAILLALQLPEDAPLLICFAFVCWLGGWFGRELAGRVRR